jgi:uncharacterized integral membrane protein (TIGR00697 family)
MAIEKNYRFLPTIAGLFTATLCISNTLDTKIFSFLSLDLPSGIILFPIAYLFADVLTEVYGYAQSRRIIWTGLAAVILMVLTFEIARRLPPAGFWKNQDAFDAILGQVPRLVLASICAYFCGEFVNSYTLAKLKVFSEGHRMAVRFMASTVVGQAVDTASFVVIAFTGIFPVAELISITISAWAVKVGWELIALPITLPIVRWIKRVEAEDFFDVNTNFNPFRLAK